MLTGDLFEIHYANGKIELASSLEDAARKVAHEASDERMHGLLPAIIFTHPSDVIGTGKPVKTITAEDVTALVSPATDLHRKAANYKRRQLSHRESFPDG
jgi:hypothetical protein